MGCLVWAASAPAIRVAIIKLRLRVDYIFVLLSVFSGSDTPMYANQFESKELVWF